MFRNPTQQLRKITNVKNINNDIMRSSYINWFYDNNKKLSEREKLANEMRHSVMTSQRNYRKIIDNNITNDELKNKVELLDQQLKSCESKIMIDDKLYKKRRRDIIYNINKKGVVPKEDTLKNIILFMMMIKNYIFKNFLYIALISTCII